MLLNQQQRLTIKCVLMAVVIVWHGNGIYLPYLAKISVSLYWFGDIMQWVVFPVVVVTLWARKASVFPKQYGFVRSALNAYSLLLGSTGVFLSTGLVFFLTRNIAWNLLGGVTSGQFNLPNLFPDGHWRTVAWLYSALSAGLVESLFFIGLPWLLYNNGKACASKILFTILASLIFAAAHWEQGAHVIVGAFFSHIIACIWYFRHGNLWSVSVGHMLVDLVAFA